MGRRHGIYVWGESWQKAKTMVECYDYLCEIGYKMITSGLDPASKDLANKTVKGRKRAKKQ
jgi:methylthioribulose-1-phosphate dehydratase